MCPRRPSRLLGDRQSQALPHIVVRDANRYSQALAEYHLGWNRRGAGLGKPVTGSVKKSVGRRKRLPHKKVSPCAPKWDRRFRLSTRRSQSEERRVGKECRSRW